MSTRTAVGPTGWAIFAGSVLAIVGGMNVIYGLTAIFKDEVLTSTGGKLIVWDLTAWGWILLIFGAFQLLAAAGLFSGAEWARWAAIVLAGLNAITSVGMITEVPIWTLLIVGLDIIVIYQLSARWVRGDTAGYVGDYETLDDVGASPTSARDQMTRTRTGL
jgi:hypothetical protein